MTGMNTGFAAIKSRQQEAWSSGNYAVVGATLQMERGNRSGNGALVLPGEYLEVVVEKRR